jgi:dTDP-4-dehydrorhamnose 3,5-epimerase
MEFEETSVKGAYVVKPRKIEDERGWFARIWCAEEFAATGLSDTTKQFNMGVSRRKGTLRGLHYQLPPHQEVKILRCIRGSMFDVVVDLRPDSPTFRQWYGVELNQDNNYALYVPEGCATGYLTLEDDVAMCYQASEFYHPQSARGVRFDDPAFDIAWPVEIVVMSEQDRSWPSFTTIDV